MFNCHFLQKRTSSRTDLWNTASRRQKWLIIFSRNLVISATIHGWKNLLLSGRSAKRSTLAPRKIYNVLHSLLVRLHFSFSMITKQKRSQKISPKKVLKTKKLSKPPWCKNQSISKVIPPKEAPLNVVVDTPEPPIIAPPPIPHSCPIYTPWYKKQTFYRHFNLTWLSSKSSFWLKNKTKVPFFSPARRNIEKKMIVHRKCSIFYAFPVYFPRKNSSLPEFEFDLVRQNPE